MPTYLNILDNIVEVPRNLIPVTRQANDIAEMETRQSDYSARVKLPLTARIRDLLGFPDTPGSTLNKAYEAPESSVIASGIPLIEKGTGRILAVTDQIDFMVNGPGYSFWRDIEKLDLHDIDWEDLDFELTLSNAQSMLSNTDGILFSAIDYGGVSINVFDIRYTHPAIFFKTIVDRIITERGYTYRGDVLTDPLYDALALPFSKSRWEHSARFLERNGFDKSISAQFNASDFTQADQANKFTGVVNFDGNPAYTAIDGITLDMDFTFNVITLNRNYSGSATVDVKVALRQNGVIIATQSIPTTGSYTFSNTGIALSPGDTLDIAIVADFQFVSGYASYQLEMDSANFYTPEVSKDINLGDTITAEAILPKMGQKVFLKAFMQLFGLIAEIDEAKKEIHFRYFNELYDNIPRAKDWTEKLIKPESALSHIWFTEKRTRIGNYAQSNYGNYLPDELNADSQLGRGTINVDDASLEATYDLFTMPWAASETVTRLSLTPTRMVRIPFWEEDEGGSLEQTYEPKQRICYITRPATTAYSLEDGSAQTTIAYGLPVSNFIEPNNAFNLGFGNNLLARFYSGLSKMLTKAERYTVRMRLGPADVANHDFLVPVYLSQLGGYFYVNKISNYIQNELTEVQIIKL